MNNEQIISKRDEKKKKSLVFIKMFYDLKYFSKIGSEK